MAGEVIKFTILGDDKSGGVFNKTTKAVVGMAKAVAAATAAVVAGGAAVVLFTNKVATMEDKVAKIGKRLGASTARLTELAFAAEEGGVSFDTMAMATQRMTRRVAEAAKGSGEAIGAISELGLSADQLAKMTPDEQIRAFSDSLAGLENQSDKVRLAFKLFDSEGVSMLQFLGQGTAALDEAARKAQFFGVVVSDQAAAAAERFKDQMHDAQSSMKGLSMGIADELIPIVGHLAEKFAVFVAENREKIVSWVKTAVKNFVTFANVFGQVFEGVKKRWDQLFSKEGFEQVSIMVQDVLFSMIDYIKALMPIVGSMIIEGFRLAFVSVTELGKVTMEKLFDLASGQNIARSYSDAVFGTIAQEMEKSGELFKMMLEDMEIQSEEAGTRVGENLKSLLDLNIESAQIQAEEFLERLIEIDEIVAERQMEQLEQTSEFYLQLTEMAQQFYNQSGNIQRQYAKLVFKTYMDVAKGIGQAFAQVIVEGGKLKDALIALMKQVLTNLIATLVEMGVRRMILSAITKTTAKADAATEASKAVGLATANAIASTAAAPYPLNLTAPAVGAATGAAAAAGFASGAATGAGLGAGIVHGGMDYIPKETTYFLDKGERVLSPGQNRDLTSFLDSEMSGNGSYSIEIGQITLFEGVTDPIDFINNANDRQVEEFVFDRIIPALDRAARMGMRQLDNERKRDV